MRALPNSTIVDSMLLLLLDHLGLQQLELHAHRSQLLAQQERFVGERQPEAAPGAS